MYRYTYIYIYIYIYIYMYTYIQSYTYNPPHVRWSILALESQIHTSYPIIWCQVALWAKKHDC